MWPWPLLASMASLPQHGTCDPPPPVHNPRHVKVCKQPCHALCLHMGLRVDGGPLTTRHLIHPLHPTAPPPPRGCCARYDHVSESG